MERLLHGAITHPANREILANFVAESTRRRGLLEHLHAGALRYLYRLLFVLYAEARGLLPLDMPAYRDGYALTGARGLVRRALDRAHRSASESGCRQRLLRTQSSLLSSGCCATAPTSDLKDEQISRAGSLIYPLEDAQQLTINDNRLTT